MTEVTPQSWKSFVSLWESGWATEAKEFQSSLFEAEQSRSLVGLTFAAGLYPLFSLLDRFVYQDYFAAFLLVRLIPAVMLLVLAIVVRRARTYSRVVAATALGYVVPASSIALMCHLTEGIRSPYYAGIALCTVFVAAFLTWPVSLATRSCGIVLCVYFLPALWTMDESDVRYLSLHGSFLVGTTVLVVLGMKLRVMLAWQIYSSRLALSRRNKELADLHELKDRMFQNVSHELRTPLTMMLTPLQRRLERHEDSEEERRWTREMYRNGMRLLKQINDLLDLARLESSEIPVESRVVDVKSVLAHLIDDLRASAHATGVDLRLVVPEEPQVYVLDPHHLERIVLNLLANALKFTPPGGRVLVFLESVSDGLLISVEDTGPGIPSEAQDRVFDRFRQIDASTRRRYGGSGIGLALVSELTELMGGSVEIESEEGEGSRFTVRLPAVQAIDRVAPPGEYSGNLGSLHRQADREALSFRSNSGERSVAGTSGPGVLVVEDDDRLRRHLVEILAEKHRVVGVARGEEALREALLFRPQVVVSDVMMPGMDGVEFCRRLRERSELRQTAVILLTAKGRVEDRIEGRKVGADSYLTKPFDVRELQATIEGLLRARMHLVGEYLVQSPLGRGGQSEVWLAEHRATGGRVALKVIRPGGLEDARARERLRREHEALTRLEHANIVRIVARGEQAGGLYLAMEYLEGVTLDELVRSSGALPPEAVATICRSVADALSHVHASGLVHRDVKCSNVMLLKEEQALGRRVRLIDFGTAAAVGRGEVRSEKVVGSLSYLAPELLLNNASASPATDIYGLGVVMYRLATGILPYRGSTAGELIDAFGRGAAPPIEEVLAGIPGELSAIVARAMALESAARWRTADDLGDSLRGFPEPRIRIVFPETSAKLGPTQTFRRDGQSLSATTTQ